MEIQQESKKVLITIEKLKEIMSNKKEDPQNLELFKGIEIHKTPTNKTTDPKDQPKSIKPKKAVFRVSYLTTVIQFLDLKTILNISIVNRQFYHFIKSIYLFKIMNNVKQSKERLKKDTKKSEHVSPEETGIFSKLTGFLGKLFINLGFGMVSKEKSKVEVDHKALENKINIYQKILKAKLTSMERTKEVKLMRQEIDKLKNVKSYKDDEIQSDERIMTMKKEKTEKEHLDLLNEVDSLKKEVLVYLPSMKSLNKFLKFWKKKNYKIQRL
jgi:hypothetical protein